MHTMRYFGPRRERQSLAQAALLEALGEASLRAADEPQQLREILQDMTHGLREALQARAVELEVATSSETLRVFAGSRARGQLYEASAEDVVSEEAPIMRGRIALGHLRVHGERHGADSWAAPVSAAAGFVSLAVTAAESSREAARRATQGSVVQLATEALGSVMDEDRLYDTVLVLTMELVGSSAAVILDKDEKVASRGFEDRPDALRDLRAVPLDGRVPWRGRIRGGHALGARLGNSGAGIFLYREKSPYNAEDGATLKLVARQLAHARERSRLHAALEETDRRAMLSLAAALESRDGTTGDHIRRTEALAGEVASRMGLGAEDAQACRYAAVLHDIGKIGVPDRILSKPGKLTPQEWSEMKRHPEIGARILSGIPGFERVAEAILTHHERVDGKGYPRGLSGQSIPVESRVVAAVDAFDAMTNDRPYRKAASLPEALDELNRHSGEQFDPEVVTALQNVLRRNNSQFQETH